MRSLLSEEAVSSVVGTVLILAITVSTFGGFAIIVMREVEDNASSPAVDLQVQSAGGQYIIKHRGGASLPVTLVTLYVHEGGTRHEFPLTAFSLGDTWDIGESVIVSEVFSGEAQSIEVVSTVGGRSTVLAAAGEAAGTAAPGAPSPVDPGEDPDLTVPLVTSTAIVVGASVTFEAVVDNLGTAADASSMRFEILEATTVLWSETVATPPIAELGTTTVTSPPWTAGSGTYTVYVAADNEDVVAESDEGNNVWLSDPFTPAADAAGLAYIDEDDDGAFTPGLDEQVHLGALTDADCAGRACIAGDHGFVVADPGDGSTPGLALWPQAVTAGVDVYLGAPGGITVTDSTISVTGNQVGIRLVAGGAIDLAGATLASDGNQDGVTIDAGQDILAAGATTRGNTLTFTAPATAQIHQEGLSLLNRNGTPFNGATNTNNSCVFGTLAQGTWATQPPECTP